MTSAERFAQIIPFISLLNLLSSVIASFPTFIVHFTTPPDAPGANQSLSILSVLAQVIARHMDPEKMQGEDEAAVPRHRLAREVFLLLDIISWMIPPESEAQYVG